MYIYIYIYIYIYLYIYICEIWVLCLLWNTYDHLFSTTLNIMYITSKEKEEWNGQRKENAKIKITMCESGSKVTLGGAWELDRLLTTRHKFVWFDVTSPVDIDCARSSFCVACFCHRKCSSTHRNQKSHRYFNINILNTLICLMFILMHLWNNLTGFYVILVWFSNRRVIVMW